MLSTTGCTAHRRPHQVRTTAVRCAFDRV